MPAIDIPNFGKLLAPALAAMPAEALPSFLARLERTAADRYRMWAEAVPEHAEGLLACAEREDEIASSVEKLYPVSAPELIEILDAAIGPAKEMYYAAFAGLTPLEQMTIQANAERQGAAAWRGMVDSAGNSTLNEALEKCAQIEESNADYLDALLKELGAQ